MHGGEACKTCTALAVSLMSLLNDVIDWRAVIR